MKAFEGYTYLDGGICAAKGFQASGTYCGIKKAMAPDSNEGEIGKEKMILHWWLQIPSVTPLRFIHRIK